jgi:hypothetical protein
VTQVEKLTDHIEIVGQLRCSVCHIYGDAVVGGLAGVQLQVELEVEAARILQSSGWRVIDQRVSCPDCILRVNSSSSKSSDSS